MSCVINKYWSNTYTCEEHGLLIRIYLASIIAIICVNLILLTLIVNRSAQGGITEISRRWLVAPLLTVKIMLILPETVLNVFGTVWAFCDSISCKNTDFYSKTVIESEFLKFCKEWTFFWNFYKNLRFPLIMAYNILWSKSKHHRISRKIYVWSFRIFKHFIFTQNLLKH
jgi:sn1-specific diacylglycerol lipase